MASLSHAHKPAIERVRTLLRGLDPRVGESVKWNAPSYALDGQDFVTFHLRAKQGFMLVLHAGAKKRGDLPERGAIKDPGGLLKWVADDRATISLRDLADVQNNEAALTAVLGSWLAALPRP